MVEFGREDQERKEEEERERIYLMFNLIENLAIYYFLLIFNVCDKVNE